MKKALSVFILLPFLCGCIFVAQNINDNKLQGVSIGMSKTKVIDQLGKPQATKTIVLGRQEYEVWQYPLARKWEGKINALGNYCYEILFLGNEVYRWDLIKAYAQPAYDYQEPDSIGEVITSVEIIKE